MRIPALVRIIASSILSMPLLPAQQVVYLPGDPRYKGPVAFGEQVEPPRRLVFTLQKPTLYEIPKDIQRMIMGCFRDAPAVQVLVWRDEYNIVKESKEDLKAWLDGVLTKRERLQLDEAARANSLELKQHLFREIAYTRDWREFNQRGW